MVGIIDTHVHLLDQSRLNYDWTAGTPLEGRAFLPQDVRADADAGDVELRGIVFEEVNVRSSDRLAEVDWVNSLADGAVPILGIVAAAPVENADVGPFLDALLERDRVCGVRRLIEPEADGFTEQAAFRRGLQQVAERGLTFDIGIKSRQFPATNELVRALPDVPFVLDHLGKPDIAGGEWQPWAREIASLAQQENVVAAKLSGLFSAAAPGQAEHDRLRPYLEHAIDCFGAHRLMFGSDWPVCTFNGTYEGWARLVDETIAGLSDDEQAAIRSGTAQHVWGLAPRQP